MTDGDRFPYPLAMGGACVVIDGTGALRRGIDRLARALHSRGAWVIPISCITFAVAGALHNMREEIAVAVGLQ